MASPLRSSKAALLEAIFFPNRKLAPEHETTVIETTDGKKISGLVLKERARLSRSSPPTVRRPIGPKSQIKARTKAKTSIMPDSLRDSIDRTRCGISAANPWLAQRRTAGRRSAAVGDRTAEWFDAELEFLTVICIDGIQHCQASSKSSRRSRIM